MKPFSYLAAFAVALIVVVLLRGVLAGPKFQVGDHVMPAGSSNPQTILKIVGVTPKSYKVFTHFLSQGQLVLAEDYSDRPRQVIDRTYIKIPAPKVDSTFSPDKYISAAHASPSPK